MNNIPLQVRLKREVHRKIASTQDLIVKEVYKVFDKAVLHGGTAIWRCYSGRRFSEDLDFYLPKHPEKIEHLFDNLKKIGFLIKKKKIEENSIYSELEQNRISVRLEATFQNITGVICDYELSDGNFIDIYSLTPEQFITEKTNTYLKRFKVRDFWDVFFLSKIADNYESIGKIVKNYQKPVDESDLKIIILDGPIPTFDEMFEYLKRKWEKNCI